MTVSVNSHPAYNGIDNLGFLQLLDHSPHGFVNWSPSLEKHTNLLHSLPETDRRSWHGIILRQKAQNNSLIGCTAYSTSGSGRFCGPGSSLFGSSPSPLNSVAA